MRGICIDRLVEWEVSRRVVKCLVESRVCLGIDTRESCDEFIQKTFTLGLKFAAKVSRIVLFTYGWAFLQLRPVSRGHYCNRMTTSD